MAFYKNPRVFITLTLICALVMIFEFFFDAFGPLASFLSTTSVFLGSFTLGIGMINLARIHYRHVNRRTEKQWPLSIIFIVFYFGTFLIGLLPPLGSNEVFKWLYNNIYLHADVSMGAMIALLYAGAIYRTFQVKNRASLVFIIAFCLILLRNAPIGTAIWPGFTTIGDWIVSVPTSAVFRGVIIGTAIGLVAFGIRVTLGKQPGYPAKSLEEG